MLSRIDEHTMEESDYLHQADSQPIPGYRLLAPLGRGGFGEVWKCEAPGGLHKAVKFVHGGRHILDEQAPAVDELRAIQHVKSIRHPFILTLERVEIVDGVLVMVMELADHSLADLLDTARQAGSPGLSRGAILNYLREASEVLDVMQTQHGVQHLDVKPRNLFLVSNHVKVGDFGLVTTLAAGKSGNCVGAITPRYAAPELFQGEVSANSDQYSLAIVYQELLTGRVPFDGRNARQLMFQHLQNQPDLSALPEGDRLLVARALAKDPQARFPSCMAFVEALLHGHAEVITLPVGSGAPPAAAHDTRRTPPARTARLPSLPMPGPPTAEGTAGLTVTALLTRTPFTEVWAGRAADGSPQLVKVLFGGVGPHLAAARPGSCGHPILLPMQVLAHQPGRMVLTMPAGDRSLRDVLSAHQGRGQPGLPRHQVLQYLRPVAEGLDHLARHQKLFHLGLNPRCLVLEGERCRVADFGLAQLHWQPAGQSLAQLNARYSAPELARGQADAASDQYSLALIYHELLTGVLPAPGVPARKGMAALPCVDRLSEADRPIIARALHPDPRQRWPGLIELFQALEAVPGEAGTTEVPPRQPALPTQVAPRVIGLRLPAPTGAEHQQVRLGTNLSAEAVRERFEGFGQQWNARLTTAEPRHLVYEMQTPGSLWQRWTGRQPRIEVDVTISDPVVAPALGGQLCSEVHVYLLPHNCAREASAQLLQHFGPVLIESVRTHLRVNPRGRAHERTAWLHRLVLRSILADGSLGLPVECQGKDLSLTGIGFYLPGQLPGSLVKLELPKTAQTPATSLQARVVRVQNCGDGWYEVGALFLPPERLPDEEAAAEPGD